MTFSHSSKDRLTEYDLDRFPGDTLFARLARAVCEARCLPRKELYEAWETARRARRLFRGGRVVDLAAGHGLLAHVMLLLDDSSPQALAVDPAPPASARRIREILSAGWPRLADRIVPVTAPLDAIDLREDDVVVSNHACGALTDVVLERAADARARVAVLPCCHDLETCDPGPLRGWTDGSLAVDVMRALRLEARGYRVWTQRIRPGITPKDRLLLGRPQAADTDDATGVAVSDARVDASGR